MPPDLPKALRDDVRLLGEVLGETLRRQESEALYETVERVRGLAKGARAGSTSDFTALTGVLEQMPVEEALPVARAFSQFLTLANIAEQHHRIRRRRVYERDPEAQPQIGSCDETLGRLRAAGIAADALFDAVTTLRIELVFTAHPTEVTRRTLMQKHRRIAEWLERRDRPDLTIPEREDLLAALRREVAAAWETSEIRRERPSPLDEVRSGLVVFEQTLWDTLPRYLRVLDAALVKHTGRGLPLEAAPITFGSWIGGDRDGNPAVTAPVTRTTCLLARWQALTLYLHEIDALRFELSMSEASDELRARVSGAHEPYRALLRGVRDRLEATIPAPSRRSSPGPSAATARSSSTPTTWRNRCVSATGRFPLAATGSSRTGVFAICCDGWRRSGSRSCGWICVSTRSGTQTC